MKVVEFRLVVEQDDGTQIEIQPAGDVRLEPIELVQDPIEFFENPLMAPVFSTHRLKHALVPIKLLPNEKTGVAYRVKVVKGP